MEQLKIGDLVRRDENDDAKEVEGVIVSLWGDGKVRRVKLTKDYRRGLYKVGQTKNCSASPEYQGFYLVSQPKYPPIKTKFLGGYIE